MVSYSFGCNVTASFWKKDKFMILADGKIYLIKVVETHQFSDRPSNLCQPHEILFLWEKKCFWVKKFLIEVPKFFQSIA